MNDTLKNIVLMKKIIQPATWIAYALMMIFGGLWVLRETGTYDIPKPENLVAPTMIFGVIGFILNRFNQNMRND